MAKSPQVEGMRWKIPFSIVMVEFILYLGLILVISFHLPSNLSSRDATIPFLTTLIVISAMWILGSHISWGLCTIGFLRWGRKIPKIEHSFNCFAYKVSDTKPLDPIPKDLPSTFHGETSATIRYFLIGQAMLAIFTIGVGLHVVYNPFFKWVYGEGVWLPPLYLFSSIWPVGVFPLLIMMELDLKMKDKLLAVSAMQRIATISVSTYIFILFLAFLLFWHPSNMFEMFSEILPLIGWFLLFNALFSITFFSLFHNNIVRTLKERLCSRNRYR